MTDNALEFLDGQPEAQPETETAQVEATTQESAPPEPAQVEGKGDTSAPPAEPEQKSHLVPLTVVLDERFKRQEVERRLAEYEARERAAKAAQEAPKVDYFADPEGAMALQQSQFQKALIANKLQTSRFLASREFGKDLVAEAEAFFDRPENHGLTWKFVNEPSPFHAAVEHFQREKARAEIGDDPVKFREKIAAELKEQLRAELMAELGTQQPVRKPPPTLATAPGAGKATSQPIPSGFDLAFGG